MAHKTFIIPNSSGAASFGGTEITSAVDWTYDESGDVTVSNSDANTHVQAVYVDNITATATVNVLDSKQLNSFRVGDDGSLIIRCIERDKGDDVTGSAIVKTMSNAVVTAISQTCPHLGEGAGSITFQIGDNGSDALYAIS